MKTNAIICWWSGGVTSAVACHLSIELYGLDACRFVFQDTKNEDDDTYRFKKDCEKWYGKEIEEITTLTPDSEYKKIQDVWRKYNSLNVAHGAICSSTLKRDLRVKWQKMQNYKHQVFGFDIDEPKRAKGMATNYPEISPIFPLLLYGIRKKQCLDIIQEAGINVPNAYAAGFHNNNCWKTGCVQGGIGYWQKMKREYPNKFNAMADIEHELTESKGEPVTMLKDQGKESKTSKSKLVFLKPHPKYPQIKDISMMKGREVKPLIECNGFCGVNDLSERSTTEKEINTGDEPLTLF